MLDGERVKAAQLCCLMVATCRHPEADGLTRDVGRLLRWSDE